MANIGFFKRKDIAAGEAYEKGFIKLVYKNKESQTCPSGSKATLSHTGLTGTTDVTYASDGSGESPAGNPYFYLNATGIDAYGPGRGLYAFSGSNIMTIPSDWGAVRTAVYVTFNDRCKIMTDTNEQYFCGIEYSSPWYLQKYYVTNGSMSRGDIIAGGETPIEWNMKKISAYLGGLPSDFREEYCHEQDLWGSLSYGSTNCSKYQPNGNVLLGKTNHVATSFTPLITTIEGINVFFDYEEMKEFLLNGTVTPETDPEDEPYVGPPVPYGTDYGTTDFNDEINNTSVLSRALILSRSNMDRIADVLYNTDPTSLLDGLQLYGYNPISFVVDCFYLPFNPRPFCTIESTQTNTNFGSYSAYIGEHSVIGDCSKTVTVGTLKITGAYNDFRDYITSNYYIYLPFCGIMGLDIEKYMYHTLTVKVFFDVRTGALKYYLLSDNVVQDMYEASVRQNMPLISTDNYQSSREKISSIFGLAGNAVTLGTGIASGNPASIMSAFASGTENALNLQKAPPVHTSGGFNPASSIIDSLDVMIWVEQQDVTYPSNMKATYGIPDNRITTLGTASGFVQCDDIILESNHSQARKDRAKALIMQGVFI